MIGDLIMDLLVGSTGFVGGNIRKTHSFFSECHSIDVERYYGSKPDLCVYAGVPSAMYIANSNPQKDLVIMDQARRNLRYINPKKVVLISTVAVYSTVDGVNEESDIDVSGLSVYGANRLILEEWVQEDFTDVLIVRLPALYGSGLKKNFLYDLHAITPAMLTSEKYHELCEKCACVKDGYEASENGFYKLSSVADVRKLRRFFENNDFNALSFTDSRSRYQFYNLHRLWDDICVALDNGMRLVNLVTPPISAEEIYRHVFGKTSWINHTEHFFNYDVRTVHENEYGGKDGYIISRDDEIEDICCFMKKWDVGVI